MRASARERDHENNDEDEEKEGRDDGDIRRRCSSRGGTVTITSTDEVNSDDAVASSDKGASVKCRRTSTAYNN